MSDSNNIVLIGGGGFAKEIIDFIEEAGHYKIEGYFAKDQNPELKIPFLGTDDELEKIDTSKTKNAFVAVGIPEPRKRLTEKAKSLGLNIPSIIHPGSYVAPSAKISDGCVVYPNATINADCDLAESVLVNSNVSIGHESKIQAYANLNPGCNIAGNVYIGEGSFIGIGANVKEGTKIGSWCTIGGGAMIIKDVQDNQKIVGVPGRAI